MLFVVRHSPATGMNFNKAVLAVSGPHKSMEKIQKSHRESLSLAPSPFRDS
jgi:hypothetical protein